jgi:hypothetical protein
MHNESWLRGLTTRRTFSGPPVAHADNPKTQVSAKPTSAGRHGKSGWAGRKKRRAEEFMAWLAEGVKKAACAADALRFDHTGEAERPPGGREGAGKHPFNAAKRARSAAEQSD